jgi:hypothetical protein
MVSDIRFSSLSIVAFSYDKARFSPAAIIGFSDEVPNL